MFSGNEITHMMTNVCTCEIVLVTFFYITCTTELLVKHLCITCTDNYTGATVYYVHIENNSYDLANTLMGNLDR